MELKFVAEVPHGNRKTLLAEFLAELSKHPNRWAEFPETVNSNAVVQQWKKKYKGFEFRVSGGNNLAKSHPDKKVYKVYVCKVEEN